MNAPTNQTLLDPPLSFQEITEYNATTAALVTLKVKYAVLPDVMTPAGLSVAKAARAEIRGYRVALEKTRTDLKAPLLAQGQWIDAEAQRIKAELLAIEEPIDAAIKAEEQRQAKEKDAKKRAEAERRAALEARIDALRARVVSVAHQEAAAIREALQEANAWAPDPDEFAEIWPQAMKARAEVRHALETLLAQRDAWEARQAQDAARWQAQQEVLARQHAESDRQRAEEEAQRQAEREELARLRALEAARQAAGQATHETPKTAANEPPSGQPSITETDPRAKPTALKRRKANVDPLTALKAAFEKGALRALEAIDRAYQIGFEAGEQAARKAA